MYPGEYVNHFESVIDGIGLSQVQIAQHGEMWFALRVKSNFERTTATHLRHKGYTEFLPTYKVRSRWSDRYKNLDIPLFPGYVFCRFDPQYRLPILAAPGVLHIVGVGKQPAPIDQSEIRAVQTTLSAGVAVEPWAFLQTGERVVVERGPLAGIEGLVTEFKGMHRLVVSVTLLQRSIAAEIERAWVRPIYGSGLHKRQTR